MGLFEVSILNDYEIAKPFSYYENYQVLEAGFA
jgi:hypothetical protein